ncbi:MAG: LysR family transcriptional regulator, partial [Planctomycetes bacterium]|nr:LysR family transcriptional regulator [Planctomycetota bacterium]
MDRLLRLDALWNWLPAFRAVGETQHLPSAATALHVSPSALSRSVRLLEQRLGCTLFERRSR